MQRRQSKVIERSVRLSKRVVIPIIPTKYWKLRYWTRLLQGHSITCNRANQWMGLGYSTSVSTKIFSEETMRTRFALTTSLFHSFWRESTREFLYFWLLRSTTGDVAKILSIL